jgi:hypothetical protein
VACGQRALSQGKTVSGLHVWNNVQVIPAVVNLKKANRFNTEGDHCAG